MNSRTGTLRALAKLGGRTTPTPVPAPAKGNAQKRAKGKKRKRQVFHDIPDDVKKIARQARPWTMTSREKMFALITATQYISRHSIEGSIVECGVWRGGSMHAVSRALHAAGDVDRDLYLFDTFEGMPPPDDIDVRWDGASAADLMASRPKGARIWAVATRDDVEKGLDKLPYPRDRFHLVQGLVEETVPEHAPERIALLRLDTDWYSSTKHELTHLYPRLVSGGVLIIDDYGSFEGARKAVVEWMEETGERLLLVRAGNGRIAVKP